MIIVFLLAVILLLAVIVVQLGAIAGNQRAVATWLHEAFKAREYSFLESLIGEPRPRTIVDQIGELLAHVDERVAAADRKLAYLRSYFWEVKDHRYLGDIQHPPESVEWGRRFRSRDDPNTYGLWERERDLSEEFHRTVVMPDDDARRRDGVDEEGAAEPPS